jgi:hypothetical protein
VPLVTVLRDTLGDDNPENDRLRYVWMLTYTQPSMAKRIAAAIPFLYRRVETRGMFRGRLRRFEFVTRAARNVGQILRVGSAERVSRHLWSAAESFDPNLPTEFV